MNYFIYDGKKSSDFGVYISGSGTYGGPERDMEAVSIPGKNGDLLLDNGRWKNKTLSYPAFIPKTFSRDIEPFRAWLLSSPGYKRLEDSYHPDEFRKACYRSGLDPKTGVMNFSGEFELAFDVMPPRYLKSGEKYTAPIMAGGHVAYLINDGGAEINASRLSTALFQSYDSVTLKAVPHAGHALSELQQGTMMDDDYYAAYAVADLTDYYTNDIVPDLVNGGFTINAADSVLFSVKILDDFDWHIILDYLGSSKEYHIAGATNLYNFTYYDAEPLIKIEMMMLGSATPSARAAFALNGVTVKVDNNNPYSVLYYDCELGDTYAISGANVVNANGYISMTDSDGNAVHEYPKLKPGENVIDYGAGDWLYYLSPSVISIMPRWWTL